MRVVSKSTSRNMLIYLFYGLMLTVACGLPHMCDQVGLHHQADLHSGLLVLLHLCCGNWLSGCRRARFLEDTFPEVLVSQVRLHHVLPMRPVRDPVEFLYGRKVVTPHHEYNRLLSSRCFVIASHFHSHKPLDNFFVYQQTGPRLHLLPPHPTVHLLTWTQVVAHSLTSILIGFNQSYKHHNLTVLILICFTAKLPIRNVFLLEMCLFTIAVSSTNSVS